MNVRYLDNCHAANFTAGRTHAVDYLVIHYTANNGDTVAGNCNYFSLSGRGASAHYFVDETEACRSVLETDTAWHAGQWAMNCRSIGIELCSRKDAAGKYYFKPATVDNAATLVRALMAKYGISPDHVIRHYDVTGKVCPAPFVDDPAAWAAFKAKLTAQEAPTKQTGKDDLDMTKDELVSCQGTGDKPSSWARDATEYCKAQGIFNGDGQGNYGWQQPITREAVAVIIHNFAQKNGLA